MAVYILGKSAGEAAKCHICLFKIPFKGRSSLNTRLCFLQDPGERSSSLLLKDTVEGTGMRVEGLES